MSITLYEELNAFRSVYRDICSWTVLKRMLFMSMGTRLCILFFSVLLSINPKENVQA